MLEERNEREENRVEGTHGECTGSDAITKGTFFRYIEKAANGRRMKRLHRNEIFSPRLLSHPFSWQAIKPRRRFVTLKTLLYLLCRERTIFLRFFPFFSTLHLFPPFCVCALFCLALLHLIHAHPPPLYIYRTTWLHL